ncbi:MAG: nucleotide exchange factor GrpE [Verrucomicrobiales bacterium]|nr:nucleotide exchange factor GrpE [Verrucomicrobiales bacterium]MCP5559674.1 nucleotide exchange factor GrpE [Verrucomicrobiaceae bacterium]
MTDTPPPSPESIDEILPPEAAAEEGADAAPLDPLEAALKDADHWKDLAYRSQAELDNFRKRAAREAQDTRSYANAEILRALFPILDNFEMGLDAARNESETSMIFMGMNMVHRQMADFLRDHGVQEIEALGKPFDPNLHDAITQEPTADQPEGTVLRVTRRGYKLRDRMLRPASVIVSTLPGAEQA